MTKNLEKLRKKGVKKTAKKTRKAAPRKVRAGKPTLSFKEKLSQISQSVRELPVTGTAKDGNYWFDRASEVFPIFNDLFAKYRILPPRLLSQEKKIVSFGSYPAYELTCVYVIEDIDSSEQERLMASGQTFKGDWSLDAAHTWTLKRALKDRFLAACPQPEGGKTSDEFFEVPGGIQHAQDLASKAKAAVLGNLTQPEVDKQFEKAFETPEPEKPKEPKEPTEPLNGMSRPGKNQQLRIDKIIALLKTNPYIEGEMDEQEVINSIWMFPYSDGTTNRWPKNNEEIEEVGLNLS